MRVFNYNGASMVHTTAAFAGEEEGQDQTPHNACTSVCDGGYRP